MVIIPFLPQYTCTFYKVLNNIFGAYFHLKKRLRDFFFFNPESGSTSKLGESHWNPLSVMTDLGRGPYSRGKEAVGRGLESLVVLGGVF